VERIKNRYEGTINNVKIIDVAPKEFKKDGKVYPYGLITFKDNMGDHQYISCGKDLVDEFKKYIQENVNIIYENNYFNKNKALILEENK